MVRTVQLEAHGFVREEKSSQVLAVTTKQPLEKEGYSHFKDV